MADMDVMLTLPEPANGCACFDDASRCICPPVERRLRALSAGEGPGTMTNEQRAWCRREILSIEGYDEESIAGVDDRQLAHTVLSAWLDYCRDKGLI